jgi:aminoglycoside phosphotransferase family enzyme
MRRFPDDALWSDRVGAGTLEPRHVDAMARRLADFHRDAAVAPAGSRFGSLEVHVRITGNLVAGSTPGPRQRRPASTGRRCAPGWMPRCARWRRVGRAPPGRARARVPRRPAPGQRHPAGDAPTAFDGIEFDDELRWIDVMDDVAFLAMDLAAHVGATSRFRLLNGWLDETGDHDGLPALRFWPRGAAAVRAHVAALAGSGARAA